MSKVVIIGGGAAGMMAGIVAARNGHNTIILEKNEKLGKKLFITGKGRCNITNAGDLDELFTSLNTNTKFMFSAFNNFNNYDTLGFFDELGLPIKVERGNRVFPESDRAGDVISALANELKRLRVKIYLDTEVTDIIASEGMVKKVVTKNQTFDADAVIVATGGKSYPSTGSTGDGYKFAKKFGLNVTELIPAIVPFNAKEEWIKELQGLSLKNVSITVSDGKKELYNDFGEMLFTHFGVSGPIVLSASGKVAKRIKAGELFMDIDLKPALTEKELDERILRDFAAETNKQFKNSLDKLLPKKLIPVIIDLSGISETKKVCEINKEERKRLVSLLKHLRVTLTSLRSFAEAIITQGGIDVKEINPSTMESKKIKGLYFAGEVIDVDAVTGGFNLQIAWSSAHLAASSI